MSSVGNNTVYDATLNDELEKEPPSCKIKRTALITQEELVEIAKSAAEFEFQSMYDDLFDYLVDKYPLEKVLWALSGFHKVFLEADRFAHKSIKVEGEDLSEVVDDLHWKKIELEKNMEMNAAETWQIQKGADDMD